MVDAQGRHRVAVVGLGIGQMHVWSWRRMKDRFVITAVADPDDARARDAASRTGADIVTFEETIARDDVDIVDLCTPPYLHVAQTLQALEAGRHVICEKPLAGSLHDVDRVAAAAKRSGRRVMPVFQYRFGHGIQKLQLLRECGVTGPAYLTTVETAWRRRPAYYAVPWRARWATELGGPVVNLAVHAHDLVRYVFGLIYLERKFAADPDMMAVVRSRLEHTSFRAEHFSSNVNELCHSVSGIYQDTLSHQKYRIKVTGSAQHLQNPKNADIIRSLLLAGIRAAFLWRQLGGHRWHFLVQRRALLRTSQNLSRGLGVV